MTDPDPIVEADVLALADDARRAARALAALDAGERNAALESIAAALEAARDRVLEANAADLDQGRRRGLAASLLDRLELTAERFNGMVAGIRRVAELPDPLDRVLGEQVRADGLVIRKVAVPIGVILIIFESRPNVAADAAALALKSGNAVVLRGGSEAFESVRAIGDAIRAGLRGSRIPETAAAVVPTTDRAAVRALLGADDRIDLVIPRGGPGLIRAVAESARMPVLKHYDGVCHIYVDHAADVEMATSIAINAKCQRPGVCNAMEALLVHRDLVDSWLPEAARRLMEHGVELRADPAARAAVPEARAATAEDFGHEFLDLVLAVAVVDDLDGAIEFVNTHGSGHSDGIVTADPAAAARFLREVDSAAVYWNASTRFTDGGEFGMGAEMGISTGKLHARGPVGLEELTSYKYAITGQGHVRD